MDLKHQKTLFLFFIFSIFFLSICIFYKPIRSLEVCLDITIHLSKINRPSAEFYYDTGNGFNETEMVKLIYPFNYKGKRKRYCVRIPTDKHIKKLRFDPLPGEGKITIENVLINRYTTRNIEYNSTQKSTFIPLNAIKQINALSKGVEIITNGDDPYLVLAKDIKMEYLEFFKELVSFPINLEKLFSGVLTLILLSFLCTLFFLEN